MPASSIAQILLRLFAIGWFLKGIYQFAGVFYQHRHVGSFDFYSLAAFIIYITAGVLFWIIAPKFSRFLAKGNDRDFKLAGVTERHLYSTAFLSLGLYSVLNSFADVFNWIHFFTINRSPDYGFHKEEAPSYYELTQPVLTLLAGLALIFTAQLWAKKLTQNKTENKPE